jgi:hypothetical protein
MYVISLVGAVVWVSALAIAWRLWSKFYVKVTTRGKMSRDNYKRFIIRIGALGVWFAVGWTLFGVGTMTPSPKLNPLSEYVFPIEFCFGASAGLWVLWVLSLMVRLRVKLQSQSSDVPQDTDSS